MSREKAGYPPESAIFASNNAYAAGVEDAKRNLAGKTRGGNAGSAPAFIISLGLPRRQIRFSKLADVKVLPLQSLSNAAARPERPKTVDAALLPVSTARTTDGFRWAPSFLGWVGDETPWQLRGGVRLAEGHWPTNALVTKLLGRAGFAADPRIS